MISTIFSGISTLVGLFYTKAILVWFVGFYAILILVGYFTPKPVYISIQDL